MNLKQKILLTSLIFALILLSGSTLIAANLSQLPNNLNYIYLWKIRTPAAQLKSDPPTLLFITQGSNNYFTDWRNILEAEGFTVTQINIATLVGNPSIASAFHVLVLDTSCEGLTQSEAETIAGIGKPVLAVGNGGYEFLNHLGAQATPLKLVQETGIHVLSLSTSYNNWDIHYHIVYQHPHQVPFNYTLHYGEISQRYIMLPLNGDSLTLIKSPKLIPLSKDITKADNYPLSVYNNHSNNHYLVHWALHNITTISQDPYGNSCLLTLVNTLHWLKNKNPYSVHIAPNYYDYNASQIVNISISAIDNLYLTLHGGITLDLEVTDEVPNLVHSDHMVTSGNGPIYTWFQLPSVPSPSYTINVTDGSLSFIESFTVQPTDYRVTEFTATPSALYLNEGGVLLNARVTVEGAPAPEAYVLFSILNRLTYPNASFPNNRNLYTTLGYKITNSSGYATYQWVPQEYGVYEVVAWIRDFDGSPKSWMTTQVTVRGSPKLSINLNGVNPEVTVGNTLRVEGNITLNSQPLGAGISINVTIYEPDGRVVNYIIFTGSAGRFYLDWTPRTKGIHTIFCTYAGNSTMDPVTAGIGFSAYQLIKALETSAEKGQISLGQSLQITANFGLLGFTPNLNDPVTLIVMNLDHNIVFQGECFVDGLEFFQTQWTPQYIGDYQIMLRFNQSYIIATTINPVKVTSSGSGSNPSTQAFLGLSLGDTNNSGFSLPAIFTVTSLGLLGCIILFTRLKKSRNEFLDSWMHSESGSGGTEDDED
ncbi:MAG: hypothetical protein ACUVXA_16585 [Candidatus Jordarchaeum sp.]|uniref:hypothetical protein n=1 Tax=Candidatus Jordarchaeum sp. TaxID=2823881 RepID=UPI0040495BC9